MLVLAFLAAGAVVASVSARSDSEKPLLQRLQRLEDEAAIVRLQNAYGYYVDKRMWDQVIDLFSDTGSVEISHRGVYSGKAGVRRMFLESWGKGRVGLAHGEIFTHMMMQPVIDVSSDAGRAKARFRTLAQVGEGGAGGRGVMWVEGVYENEFVREGGVWRFSKMRFWPTYYVPEKEGFTGAIRPNIESDSRLPPDHPPTDNAGVLPDIYYPPFHYPNPVTGRTVDVTDLNVKAEAESTTVKPWRGGEPLFHAASNEQKAN
jgi:hypothetical protein